MNVIREYVDFTRDNFNTYTKKCVKDKCTEEIQMNPSDDINKNDIANINNPFSDNIDIGEEFVFFNKTEHRSYNMPKLLLSQHSFPLLL